MRLIKKIAKLMVVSLVVLTSFIGACLLFFIQPFIARLFLPLAGGSPTLWNTCMMFFQMLLLAGYTFSHLNSTFLKSARSMFLSWLIFALPLLSLPIVFPEIISGNDTGSVWWFIGALFSTAGLPFFALSTVSPILQKWYSDSGLPGASDPYFLYSAGNLGSLTGLLAYPLVVEPFFGLSLQNIYFYYGYIVFFAAITLSALILLFFIRRNIPEASEKSIKLPKNTAKPSVSYSHLDALKWVVLSFIPSTLSLGITHHISSEIAPVPLFWSVLLALYLLSFIIAFSPGIKLNLSALSRLIALFMTVLVFAFLRQLNEPIFVILPVHILVFFLSAILCHRMLADLRPPTSDLTAFYLFMSIGGAMGGIFNTLLAPMLFDSILEYPLALASVCWLLHHYSGSKIFGSGFKIEVVPFLLFFWMFTVRTVLGDRDSTDLLQLVFRNIIPSIAVFLVSSHRSAFSLSVLVLLFTACTIPSPQGTTVHAERTFFGIHRVTLSPDGKFTCLMHGNTIHGIQAKDVQDSKVPGLYYHPSGPVGDVFQLTERDMPRQVGAVGLGVGSIAAYGKKGDFFSYFEIDPAIVRIAENISFFTYLSKSHADNRFVLGDGRSSLSREPESKFDMLIFDAFSSDSVPMHLLTEEAFRLYLKRLKKDGIMAFHISNRYISFESVLAATLKSAGFSSLIRVDSYVTEASTRQGKADSTWMVAAENEKTLENFLKTKRWQKPIIQPSQKIWTDDFGSLLSSFEF
ncbi:MAG: fused MFS/spermidine synthase [Candidatus Riflebacteria bacterium]|nr:fused MFS/spermidine synthase [Candidatus Riflebacteria bacterium]